MTIREYITQRLQSFNVSEALLTDFVMSSGLSLDDDYTFDIAPIVGKAMVSVIEDIMLSPRLSNVSEGGFSMSWEFLDMGKYYVFLCKKWGISVNEDVLNVAGLSAIMDKSNIW